MIDRLTLYLFAGCLVFGTIVFVEVGPAATESAALPELAARPAPPAAMPRKQSPRVEELLETILAGPLFSATRRPEKLSGMVRFEPGEYRLSGPLLLQDRTYQGAGIAGSPDRSVLKQFKANTLCN
jgi:hypothetical protein